MTVSVLWIGLQCVIVVFPDHTHLLLHVAQIFAFGLVHVFNPYMPGVLFDGHMQAVLTQIRWHLIRFSTVYLHNVLLTFQ